MSNSFDDFLLENQLRLSYELALSMGNTLDARHEATTFLELLTSRRGLDAAAIWIKTGLLEEEHYQLVHALPNKRFFCQRVSSNMQMAVPMHSFVLNLPANSDLLSQLLEAPAELHGKFGKGKQVLLRAGTRALVFLYHSDEESPVLSEKMLRPLRDLLEKLSVNLRACVVHHSCQLDLDRHMQHEKELQLFQELIENSRDAVYIATEEGRVIFYNKTYQSISGFTRKDLENNLLWELAMGFYYDKATWDAYVAEVKQQQTMLREASYPAGNGKYLPVEKSVRYISIQKNGYLVTFIRNISERKAAEKQLVQQSGRIKDLAQITRENPNPVFRYSSYGECLYTNLAGEKILASATPEEKQALSLHTVKAMRQQMNHETEIRIGSSYINLTIVPVKAMGYINLYGRDITSTRLAERELEKLSLVASKTSNSVIIADADGKIEWVNDSFVNITGYTLQEVKGKKPGSFLQGTETSAEGRELFRKGLKSARSFQVEILNYTKKGDSYWVETDITPILNEQGAPEKFIALQTIITSRKQDELQIRTINTRLNTLLNNLKDGIIIEDENRKLVLINHAACKLFAIPVPAEQMKGADCAEAAEALKQLFQEPDRFIERVGELLAARKTVAGEEIGMADGRILERDYLPVWIENNYRGHLWRYRDITRQKRHEEELTLKNDILRQNFHQQRLLSEISLGLMNEENPFEVKILDTMKRIGEFTDVSRVYIFEDDAEGLHTSNTYEWCNKGIESQKDELQHVPYELIPSFKKMLAREGLIFSSYIKSLPEDVYAILEPQGIKSVIIFPILKTGTAGGFIGFDECEVYRQWDESTRELLKTVSVLISNEYERKINNQNLLHSRQQALAAAKAKETFLANMSHEIRTPMNAILGMSHLLGQTRLETKQQSYLEAISTSAENLLVVLNDILDFTKIEAGKLTLEHINFELKHVVQQAVKVQSLRAAEKSIVLKYTYDENIGQVLIGDPFRLNQVLLNLLSNAIKFTEDGYVQLAVSSVESTPETEKVAFVITDTGIGIEPDRQEEIFESFKQSDSSITRKYGGTGLGLTITRELIKLFNGTIQMKSKPGRGTAFTIYINFKKGNKDALITKKKVEIADGALAGRRILLAEDHEVNQFFAVSVLENWKAEVDVASNGRQVLERLKSGKHYEVILMDIQMPEMNGIEATAHIRNELKMNIPVIALTANALKGEREKLLQQGMDGYVSKPIDPNLLYKELARQLGLTEVNNLPAAGPAEQVAVEEMFSLEQLNKISAGKQEFVVKMLNLFVQNTRSSLDQASEALQAGDLRKVSDFAHKIKPSLETFSMKKSRELALKLEGHTKNQILSEQTFHKLFGELQTELQATMREMEKMLRTGTFK